jgi:hypothetical protein
MKQQKSVRESRYILDVSVPNWAISTIIIMALSIRPYFKGRIENLVKNDILPPLEFSDIEKCIDGIKGRYVKEIKKGANCSTSTLEIIHTDICGPFSMKIVDGYDSFITFTDVYSQYGYIYPIKERSKALDKFKIFKAEVEYQHDKRIEIVWSGLTVGGVLWLAHSIWSSTWTFCKVLTGKWNCHPVFYVG